MYGWVLKQPQAKNRRFKPPVPKSNYQSQGIIVDTRHYHKRTLSCYSYSPLYSTNDANDNI